MDQSLARPCGSTIKKTIINNPQIVISKCLAVTADKPTMSTIRNLRPITTEFWSKHYAISESVDKSNTQTFGIPQRIIRSPKNDKFGLSPIPNGKYKVYFFAYSQPSELTAHGDTVVFPQQYTTVLLARARYYVHQFKDNISQSQLADAEYKKGLRTMREQLIEPFPDRMTDDRTRIV